MNDTQVLEHAEAVSKLTAEDGISYIDGNIESATDRERVRKLVSDMSTPEAPVDAPTAA